MDSQRGVGVGVGVSKQKDGWMDGWTLWQARACMHTGPHQPSNQHTHLDFHGRHRLPVLGGGRVVRGALLRGGGLLRRGLALLAPVVVLLKGGLGV